MQFQQFDEREQPEVPIEGDGSQWQGYQEQPGFRNQEFEGPGEKLDEGNGPQRQQSDWSENQGYRDQSRFRPFQFQRPEFGPRPAMFPIQLPFSFWTFLAVCGLISVIVLCFPLLQGGQPEVTQFIWVLIGGPVLGALLWLMRIIDFAEPDDEE